MNLGATPALPVRTGPPTIGLTISVPALQRIGTELGGETPGSLRLPVGVSQLPDGVEWLLHWQPGLPVRRPQGPAVVVTQAGSRAEFSRLVDEAPLVLDPHTVALLALGVESQMGFLATSTRRASGLCTPLDRVRIVGPGLPQIGDGEQDAIVVPRTAGQLHTLAPEVVWSRTIGALGERGWQLLRGLHVAVVGCGRSGSLLAWALSDLGTGRLTLIDPDRLEPHNLGEMQGLDAGDVDRWKSAALAERLSAPRGKPSARAGAVTSGILAAQSLVAFKAADVVFTCVDNSTARLAATFLANLYLKPLFDVGTGIVAAESESETRKNGPAATGAQQRRGADVRFTQPGCCLRCLGGLPDLSRSRSELAGHWPVATRGSIDPSSWQRERAGSLRSLNGVAVHLALRLFEDFVTGVLREPAWLRLEYSAQGIPSLQHFSTSARSGECACCRFTGFGEEG